MLQPSSFCVGDSGCIVEAALALGVPCELQLATTDTICVAVQSAEFKLDDETLCKLRQLRPQHCLCLNSSIQ